MKQRVRISGLYDLRTIKVLKQLKVNDFCFDLRPRSINFIQEYRMRELISSCELENITLLFANEKPFIIHSIIKALKQLGVSRLTLQFNTLIENPSQFDLPFIQHISCDEDLFNVPIENPNLFGISFGSHYIMDKYESAQFTNWLSGYYKFLNKSSIDICHILSRDWDSDIAPSLYEFLDFDILNLDINSKVESCFRNVDLNALRENLKHVF